MVILRVWVWSSCTFGYLRNLSSPMTGSSWLKRTFFAQQKHYSLTKTLWLQKGCGPMSYSHKLMNRKI